MGSYPMMVLAEGSQSRSRHFGVRVLHESVHDLLEVRQDNVLQQHVSRHHGITQQLDRECGREFGSQRSMTQVPTLGRDPSTVPIVRTKEAEGRAIRNAGVESFAQGSEHAVPFVFRRHELDLVTLGARGGIIHVDVCSPMVS